jgi:hypothetical protein
MPTKQILNFKNLEKNLNSEIECINLMKKTDSSSVYLLVTKNRNYIIKQSLNSNIIKDYKNHELVYKIWKSCKKNVDFIIPEPFFCDIDSKWYLMEFVPDANNLQDIVLNKNSTNLEKHFNHVGNVLYQYHHFMTLHLLSKRKEFTEHNTLKSVLSSKKKELFIELLGHFDRGAYTIILKDFKPSNVLIDKTNKIYLIDFQDIYYCAPFYCDIARFIDSLEVFTLFKSPLFYFLNRKRINRFIECFTKGYSESKIDNGLLNDARKMHQIEHVFMKKDMGHNMKSILLKIFYNIGVY